MNIQVQREASLSMQDQYSRPKYKSNSKLHSVYNVIMHHIPDIHYILNTVMNTVLMLKSNVSIYYEYA